MHTQTKCTAALHCQLHMCGGHHWQLAQGDWCIVVRPNPLRTWLRRCAGRAWGFITFIQASRLACMHVCMHVHASMVACIALRLGGGRGGGLTGWQGVPLRAGHGGLVARVRAPKATAGRLWGHINIRVYFVIYCCSCCYLIYCGYILHLLHTVSIYCKYIEYIL